MWIFVLLFFSLLPAFAIRTNACFDSSVQRIKIPVFPDRQKSPTFNYAFQYFPPQKRNDLTIIVVPGGPGIGLISDWTSEEMAEDLKDIGLPEGAGVVFTEPRTVDCNEENESVFPDEALKTEYIAHDLLAMIRYLKLRKYVIYGHSYGTALSTVLANLAEKDGGIPPTAVVLTGVIGKYVRGGPGSVFDGLVVEWNKIRKGLPASGYRRLKGEHLPFDWNADEWSGIIEDGLYLGRIYEKGRFFYPLQEAFFQMSYNQASSDRKALELINYFKTSKSIENIHSGNKWSQRLFEVIDCAEFTDTEPVQSMADGELIAVSDDCTNRAKLTRPFDVADYPIRAPLFYFQGSADPATPEWMARYHANEQILSNRYYVHIEDGGHNRLGPYFDDCKDGLWRSIALRGQGFEKTVKSCGFGKLLCAQDNKICDGLVQFWPRQ